MTRPSQRREMAETELGDLGYRELELAERRRSLIEQINRIRHIPAVIVQGRYDMCCPDITAVDLSRVLPSVDLRIVMAGHSAFEPLIASELVKVCDEFAGR